MKKQIILKKCLDAGVIAVIRGESPEETYKTAEACIKGGIKGIEVAFTAPQADSVIKDLQENYRTDEETVIGAGTVLDAVTARIAMLAGAEFIVSPSFNKEVAKLCNLYKIPYMPGCMTITEIQTALSYGIDIIKAFPGNILRKEFISAVKAPLPQVDIMPTGGVDLENMLDWFESGAVMVGAGSNLVGPAKDGAYQKVTENAKQYRKKLDDYQGKN